MTDEERTAYFKALSEKAEGYMLALGRFVSIFSKVEATLQTSLWKLAGVPEPTAQAVFSGLRVDACIQFIGRIADAQKWEKRRKDELRYVFSQLGMINKLRNNILHYGATMERHEDVWVVSNKTFVHIPEKIQEIRITPTLLNNATADLVKIESHLIVMTWGDEMSEIPRAAFAEILKTAWLYKPPPRDQPSRKTRTPRQKRSHRQAASRE